jgi:hypothetical protein
VAIVGDAEPISVAERDWLPQSLAEPDAVTAISIWVHGARTICDRTHLLYDVIRSAAADPDVADVLAKNKRERAVGARMLAEALATREHVNRAVPVQRAVDVLYGLATEDAYLLFVIDRGWSADEWERWAIDTITAQLLLSPAATGR